MINVLAGAAHGRVYEIRCIWHALTSLHLLQCIAGVVLDARAGVVLDALGRHIGRRPPAYSSRSSYLLQDLQLYMVLVTVSPTHLQRKGRRGRPPTPPGGRLTVLSTRCVVWLCARLCARACVRSLSSRVRRAATGSCNSRTPRKNGRKTQSRARRGRATPATMRCRRPLRTARRARGTAVVARRRDERASTPSRAAVHTTQSRVNASSSMSARTPAAVVPVPAPAPRSTSGVDEYQPVCTCDRYMAVTWPLRAASTSTSRCAPRRDCPSPRGSRGATPPARRAARRRETRRGPRRSAA